MIKPRPASMLQVAARDAGLQRISRLTRWAAAAGVALTGVISGVAAHEAAATSAHRASPATAGPATTQAPTTLAPQPAPDQTTPTTAFVPTTAPDTSYYPPVVVSGGS